MCTDLLLSITIIILKFLNSRGKVNPYLLPLPYFNHKKDPLFILAESLAHKDGSPKY